MDTIDWSKAPEGATHWEPDSADWFEGWMLQTDGRWFSWSEEHRAWNPTSSVSPSRAATFIHRPAEPTTWDGTGLPPVGTVCEVDHNGWRQCNVFAHAVEGKEPVDVLFDFVDVDGSQSWNWYDCASKFRPLRTPEQLAAEAREKAVDEMLQLNLKDGGVAARSYCERLYDAGYRKVEAAE